MTGLVLSLFSGVGALDEGFRRHGFCIVSAGDIAWSSLYDVRRFHPPAGVFEGLVCGDPCQSHSTLANLVRAKGLEPRFPDLTPEVVRVVEEAGPAWFLRENVPGAPDLKPLGYAVRSFLLCNRESFGEAAPRRRRFWFGVREGECPELRQWMDFAWQVPDGELVAVDAGHDYIDARKGRLDAVTARTGKPPGPGGSRQAVTACHSGAIGETGGPKGNPSRYTLEQMIALQGLPADLFAHSPLTMQGKRSLVGNAVSLPMAEQLAKAVRAWSASREAA